MLWRVIFFGLALAGFAVALAPASCTPQHEGVFTYSRASGSLWDARFEGVRIGPYDAGAARARLQWMRLFGGAVALRGDFEGGDVVGDVRVERGLGQRRLLRAETLRITGLSLSEAFAAAAETDIRGLEVVFANGRCLAARGALTSDVLQRGGSRATWDGPPLAGGAACRDDVALVQMSSESREGEIALLQMELRADGAGDWRISVSTGRPEAAAALQAAGFAAGPVAQEWIRSGDLLWLPW